jgi:hypothetical protein
LSRNLGTLTYWNPLGLSRPVTGQLNGNQTTRKTKTTMTKGCHGRSMKAESKKLEGNNEGQKNLE